MKKSVLSLIALCLAASCSTSENRQEQKNIDLAAEATEIIKTFAGTLQPQLMSAIQTGGPAMAIEVCSVKAQEIAKNLSDQTGWKVSRVSLKNRNSTTGAADAWEEKVLKDFDLRQQNGEPADQLAYSETVDGNFRYMQAQGVKPICLGCHGENLAPEVQQALHERYPDDKATGYLPGQVRGAFSLSKRK